MTTAVKRRRMTAREIRRVNRMRSFVTFMIVILITTTLALALTSRRAEAGKRTVPTYKYYTSIEVSTGDTLWSIAQEHITEEYRSVDAYIDEVAEINHLSNDYLRPGQHLTVPYYSTEYKD